MGPPLHPPARSGPAFSGRPCARAAAFAALAAAALVAACGYGFAPAYRVKGGGEKVHVRPFENRSADLDVGAALTAALRQELRRRGAEAGEGAPAVIEGEVRSLEGVPSSAAGATWRAGLEVKARLVVGGKPVAERTVRREADHLAGADALETEGRRAVALQRLAAEAARELVQAFEAPAG